MKYQEYNVSQSVGVVLGSTLNLGGKKFPKGHIITAEDVIILKMHDLHFIYGCEYQDGDIEYKTAYTQIAATVCGNDLGYVISDEYCQIVALDDGVFVCDRPRIDKFNSFNPDIILNTLAPYRLVKRGDVVAQIAILPPLLAQTTIDDILFRLSGNSAILSLIKNHNHRAVFVYPYILNDDNERQHFTSATLRLLQGLSDLSLELHSELNGSYTLDSLANTIHQGVSSGAGVVFVASPLQGYGSNDIMVQALRSITDDVFLSSVPQIGAADLVIANKGSCRIIVLPYNYSQIAGDFIDNVIRQAIFSEHLSEVSFNHLRSPDLTTMAPVVDLAKVVSPSAKSGGALKAKIGAVILAAGQGRRTGSNKLLVEGQDGLPMFMHAVNAAIASNAKPVFVITGHRHEELEEWLEKLDVNVIYNPAFESGVKTSIRLGLKAMPSSCDGALLLPADMPNIGAAEINKLIAKFDASQDKQLVFFTHKGVKNNPIIWSKSLYDKADLIPENAAFRVIFAEHSDYTKAVEIKDAGKLLDINFPNDVKEYAKR